MEKQSNNKMFLESIFQIAPNFFAKYKRLNNKWSKEPQEIFLKAELEMRIFLGLGFSSWLVSAFSVIFILLALIQSEQGSAIGWGIVFLICAYSGFVLMKMSNKKEAESNLEKMKYREALMNKKTTVRRMQEIETICIRSIRENITRHTYNYYLEDKETYIKLFQKLIDVANDSIKDITTVYDTNRYYDYNINEQFEVETYYTVDALKESEIMINNLSFIVEDLTEIQLLIKTEKDPIIIVNKIELLLDWIAHNKLRV